MLVFDQLRRHEHDLRWLAWTVAAGLFVLLAGLWYMQIVSSHRYVRSQNTQYYRTVRLPALRGKILDRHGLPLAENRIRYDLSLYLGDRALLAQVGLVASNEIVQARRACKAQHRTFYASNKWEIVRSVRYRVVSNAVNQVGTLLGQPLALRPDHFYRYYDRQRALPMPVMVNLASNQIARFMEAGSTMPPGLDIERQATRVYPHGTTAAHLLGYLRRAEASGDEGRYHYRLPDYEGVSALELVFDDALRGEAGGKQVLVNSLGYRQSETVLTPLATGQNVTLTIDLRIQKEAERALQGVFGEKTRGAVIVMDVRNGDLLAMASAPVFDPNSFVQGISPAEFERLYDEELAPTVNRAVVGGRSPASTFKIVTGLAALEAGWDPTNIVECTNPFYVGRQRKQDLGAGRNDFREAFKRSSNHYFAQAGTFAGLDRILAIATNFHFGEKSGLPLLQEQSGVLPTRQWQREHRPGLWLEGDTVNLCIGQGELNVTAVQMAVMTAAVANGGTIWWPRLVEKIEPPDALSGAAPTNFPAGRVRDHLRVKPQTLHLLRDAMLADVEELGGTGAPARVPGFGVCGKTGTAQVANEHNQIIGHVAWFVSFAPYDNPRYAVVVKVDGGSSGGGFCAPVAKKIFTFLQKLENQAALAPVADGGGATFLSPHVGTRGDRNVAAPQGLAVRQPSATFDEPIQFRKRQRVAALQNAGAPKVTQEPVGVATSLSPQREGCGDKNVAAPMVATALD